MSTTFGFGPIQTPAPAPVPTQPDQPAAQPYKPSMLDILQGVIFNGQSPADAAMAARSRDYAIRNMQAMAPLISSLPADQQLAARLNPGKFAEEFSKNFAPVTAAGGSTVNYEGPAGPRSTAPMMGIDEKSGSPYAITFDSGTGVGAKVLPSLGGDYGAKDGVIVSGRTGNVAGSYSLPQLLPPGTAPGSFTPSVSGGQSGRPTASAPSQPRAPAQPGGGQGGAPAGIRNLNFGNVKALPHGQMWQGQVGTDSNGYAIFADPADGVRAAATNLSAYAKQGINTIQGVVSKWAPKADNNDPVAYAKYVGRQMGIDPNAKIDLNDPATQRGLVRSIFNYETGEQAMSGFRYKPKGPQIAQNGGSSGNGAPSGWNVGQPASATRNLSPDEVRAGGYAPGSVVAQHPDGTQSVLQEGYTPSKILEMRNTVLKDPAMDDYHKALDAWGAMVNSAKLPQGGMRAYALRDTFARLINPGAVARVGTIEALKTSQGIPANVQAYLMNLKGDGDVPPEIAQQIMSVAHGFLASHYSTVKRLNDSNGDYARKVGVDPDLAMAPLDELPGRFFLRLPAKNALQKGDQVAGAKGVWTWDGKQFMPAAQ